MTVRLVVYILLVHTLHAASGSLSYSTYLGGDGADIVHAIAVDSSNNVYLTGETLSSNFPVTASAFQRKHAGTPGTLTGILAGAPVAPDAFVVKLNPAGQIVYATYLGGAGRDAGLAIAVDSSGSAYVVGNTTSLNFPVTAGALQTVLTGSSAAFVARLSPDGSALAYATYLPAASANAIALDAANNAYLGGSASAGAWAAKLNPSGTALAFSTSLASPTDATSGIAVDSAGNVYAAGATRWAGFPTTPGAVRNTIAAGKAAAFVVKLNATGGTVYSALIGGNDDSFATGLALDPQGNAYIAGSTTATAFPATLGAFQPTNAGGIDAFVARLNPSGSALVYSTLLGGANDDHASSIAVDTAGNAFISGSTTSTDFPVTSDALPKRFVGSPCLITSASPFGNPPISVPCGDAFAVRLNPAGNSLTYSTYLSGSELDSAAAVALGPGGSLYVAGWTQSDNFPLAGTPAADTRYQATCVQTNSPSSSQSQPCSDGFLAKIDFTGANVPALRVVNFGSLLEAPVAAGEVVTLYGASIGPPAPATLQLDSSNRIVTTLAGTQVFFDGVAAPLIRVDSGQISAIVPRSVAGRAHTTIAVQRNGQTTASATVVVGRASPAILTLDPSGTGQCAAVNLDGTLNGPSAPAPAGGILSLYMVGAAMPGPVDGTLANAATPLSPLPVVIVGGVLAPVLYAGPSPGSTEALTQINIQLPIPANRLAGPVTALPVFVLAGGYSSQFGATISLKQ